MKTALLYVLMIVLVALMPVTALSGFWFAAQAGDVPLYVGAAALVVILEGWLCGVVGEAVERNM